MVVHTQPRTAELWALGPLAIGMVVAGIAVAVATAVARFWLRLPAEHVKNLAGFLIESGGVSLLVTLGAAWLLLYWTHGGLTLKLGIACAIGPAVAAINTYYTADSMLIKQDDLGLLILLLAFSGSVGIAFALALARTLTVRIDRLALAARQIGSGLEAVTAPEGPDEVGELGRTLNHLARQLHAGEARRREMEEARRLLLAAVSHDLRTPLTSLRAVVEALDDGVVQDARTTSRYLASARQQVRRLEGLIDDLFELAKLDAGALELQRSAVPLPLIVEEAVESLRVQAEAAGIQLVMAVDPGLPLVDADGQRVGRVLLNILGNAIRHTPAAGRVQVTARGERDAVRVSIHDTGPGIATDDLPHIFESFYRGEKSRSRIHGGAGLGLAIARGLVEAHGGRIWAESGNGGGATFSFTLPAVPSQTRAARPTPAALSRPIVPAS